MPKAQIIPCKIQDVPFQPNGDPTIAPHTFDESPFLYTDYFVKFDIYDADKRDEKLENTNTYSNIGVGLDEYVITEKNNSDVILKTAGLGPCIGLILHHPSTKKALLAHCYCGNPTLEVNLQKMILEFNTVETPLTETQAILWGGCSDSQVSIDASTLLINVLTKNSIPLNTTYLFPQLIGYAFTPSSSFNCNTGTLTIDYFILHPSKSVKISDQRLAAINMRNPAEVSPVVMEPTLKENSCLSTQNSSEESTPSTFIRPTLTLTKPLTQNCNAFFPSVDHHPLPPPSDDDLEVLII